MVDQGSQLASVPVPEAVETIASALDPPLDVEVARVLVTDVDPVEIAKTILLNALRDIT